MEWRNVPHNGALISERETLRKSNGQNSKTHEEGERNSVVWGKQTKKDTV